MTLTTFVRYVRYTICIEGYTISYSLPCGPLLRAVPIKHITHPRKAHFNLLIVDVVLENVLLKWEGYVLNSFLVLGGLS